MMIGIDSSVLVRYLAQDDSRLSPVASRLMESLTPQAPGFITTVALIELIWVMRRRYSSSKHEIIAIFEGLLSRHALLLENQRSVQAALVSFVRSTADFPDCLLEQTARDAGCVHTVTFDRRAAKIGGMQLLR